jgi:NAD(P)H-hydrate repair Nnr-like enzyme with NAD(P)H-hydrate dehydratase domain
MFTEHPDLSPFSAIGIGPGMGTRVNTQRALKEILQTGNDKKMVIDADGLNILSSNPPPEPPEWPRPGAATP